MPHSISKFNFIRFCLIAFCAATFAFGAQAQTTEKPLTQAEFVKVLYEIPKNPNKKTELIELVRKRGIGFELTGGLRGLISTKSGANEDLKRTVEEAARRRANPVAAALPNEKEAAEVLEKARTATIAAVAEMPDFTVKQLVARAYAYANTGGWKPSDKLTVAVNYSVERGENYKVLAVNGILQPEDKSEFDFQKLGGTTSAGEFVTVLATLFKPDSKTQFEAVDTDTLRARRCIVYSFDIKRENSPQTITSYDLVRDSTIAGTTGKIWIDRENFRILRVESIATEIPQNFPVTAARRNIDYDWVTITDQKYLLPVASEVRLTSRYRSTESVESRNLIQFRNYQKYGSEVQIVEGEDIIVDETAPPSKP